MLTNFKTMRTRVDRLNQLQEDAGGRHLRHAAQEGSHQAHGRDRQAGEVSGRREGDEEAAPARCSSSTPARSATPSPRPASWASPSWPSWTPTAIPTRSTMSSPATMTPSAPSSLISAIMANAMHGGPPGPRTLAEEAAEDQPPRNAVRHRMQSKPTHAQWTCRLARFSQMILEWRYVIMAFYCKRCTDPARDDRRAA